MSSNSFSLSEAGSQNMIDLRSDIHNLSSCEMKAWKNPGLNGIRTCDLFDTGAVLYQRAINSTRGLLRCDSVMCP